MQTPYRPTFKSIVEAIEQHDLTKDELLQHIDDEYASKRITRQEYFDALSMVEETY